MSDIKIKRGTDADRRSESVAQGEPLYTTDDKTLWIGDGSTTGGLPACKPPVCATFYNTAEQDVNSAATDNKIEFNLASPSIGVLNATSGTTEDLRHSNSTNKERFTIVTAGTYLISCSVALDATASAATRYNGKLRIIINDDSGSGTEIGPSGQGGYLREASGQDETSLHVQLFAYTFAADDYFWAKVDREATVSTQVDTIARASTLFIMRVA
jgi:hypothetical protein